MPLVHDQRALRPGRCSHSSGVDGNAVILIGTSRTSDDNIGRVPNIEAVGVLALAGTSRVVDSHAGDGKPTRTVDADGLDGRVLDVEVGDGRGGEAMRGEELGLRHTAGAALAVPVFGPASIENGPGCALDGNGLAAD